MDCGIVWQMRHTFCRIELLTDWLSATRTAYGALMPAQKNAITASYSTLVNTVINGTPNISQVNELAKIVAPYTRDNSADLKSLSFSRNGYNLNIMQTSGGALAFDPAVTAYTLDTVNGSISVSATALASGATIAYSGTGLTINNGTITFGSTGTYTLTVEVTKVLDSNNNISVSKSYTVTIPYSSSSSNVPSKVCGYLPIGQFARPYSMGWGAIFTDDTNLYTTAKHAKFTASGGGYTSTGVSLGMLGGYVQFELASPLNEDPERPYGIDFIVYGNPFNGNPEAGCVMVYGHNGDDEGWYNLAGSRHYQDAQYYETLSYVRLNAAAVDLNSAFTAAGIYWSTDYVHPTNNGSVDAAIGAATWYGVPNASGSGPAGKAWWPEKASSENYQQVWKMYTSPGGATSDSHVDGVYWDTSESTVPESPEPTKASEMLLTTTAAEESTDELEATTISSVEIDVPEKNEEESGTPTEDVASVDNKADLAEKNVPVGQFNCRSERDTPLVNKVKKTRNKLCQSNIPSYLLTAFPMLTSQFLVGSRL